MRDTCPLQPRDKELDGNTDAHPRKDEPVTTKNVIQVQEQVEQEDLVNGWWLTGVNDDNNNKEKGVRVRTREVFEMGPGSIYFPTMGME